MVGRAQDVGSLWRDVYFHEKRYGSLKDALERRRALLVNLLVRLYYKKVGLVNRRYGPMRGQQQNRKSVLAPLSFICFAIGVVPITRAGSTGSHSHSKTDAEIP
jgi:hypothetical protein